MLSPSREYLAFWYFDFTKTSTYRTSIPLLNDRTGVVNKLISSNSTGTTSNMTPYVKMAFNPEETILMILSSRSDSWTDDVLCLYFLSTDLINCNALT